MKEKEFDFILFENSYSYENHYNDIVVLAVMLQKMGYTVAIADVFKENSLATSPSIPHISLRYKPLNYFSQVKRYRSKINNWQYTLYRWIQNIYLIYAIVSLKKRTHNLYLGSLTIETPIAWLLFLSGNHSYYIWGLRSYVLNKWREGGMGRFRFYSQTLYWIIKKNRRIKLIVSNEIIRDEFIHNIGICKDRIILRPERWITADMKSPTYKDTSSNTLNLLTIGTLRRNKQVELVIDALKLAGDSSINYIIAGRCRDNDGYNDMIKERSKGLKNIKRLDYYIDDEEYKDLFRQCDFLVLCDKPQKTCGSNGTMLDAIIMGRPIIAPDFEPFKTEIEKYRIGLTYKYGDAKSLADIIIEAKLKGSHFFKEQIERYRNILSEDEVLTSLQKQIGDTIFK